jgi:hypothetical protein
MKKLYGYLTLTILIMVAIFMFSSQNAEQSSEVSSTLLKWIAEKILGNPEVASSGWGTFVIRKMAHFSIYLCLGASTALTVREWKTKGRPFLWAWLIAVVYAATDEFHQYFVPGRSCEFRDVCIDGLGALIGVCIVWLVIARPWKKSARKNRSTI